MKKKVQACVLGKPIQNVQAETVRDAYNALNLGSGKYTVLVNTVPAGMDDPVSEGDFISFTQNEKGNMAEKSVVVWSSDHVVITKIFPDSDDPEKYYFRVNGKKLTTAQADSLFKKLGKALDYDL